MKCPYCAEEIKDEAILCRFCGAMLVEGRWLPPLSARPPAPVAKAHPSSFTMKFAGACFAVSAVMEAGSLSSAVPLFGDARDGAVAAIYHLFFAGLCVMMADALWSARRWGYGAMLIGTLIYTADKIRYLLEYNTREAALTGDLNAYGLGDLVNPAEILRYSSMTAVLVLLCWWAFMLYVFMKRDYFKKPGPAAQSF